MDFRELKLMLKPKRGPPPGDAVPTMATTAGKAITAMSAAAAFKKKGAAAAK